MYSTFFRITASTLGLVLILVGGIANAQEDAAADDGTGDEFTYTPDAIEWMDGPPSIEPGAEVAVLEGNPGQAGFFNLRLKLPDGYAIAPHWHPVQERVTVITGTLLLGHGEELNSEAADRYEAGSYFSLPPEMVHYASAEGETVIQLTSIGPWELNYVNPEEDPRNR